MSAAEIPVSIEIPIPQDIWDETPADCVMVRSVSGSGSNKFAVTGAFARDLPLGQAVDFIVADHRAARKAAEIEREKGMTA